MGFLDEQVQVKGYITLKTTSRAEEKSRKIKVRYLVINAPSSYNMVMEQYSFNKLGDALSTLYLCMKYPILNGRVGVIQGDHKISKKCYIYIIKLKKIGIMGMNIVGMKL